MKFMLVLGAIIGAAWIYFKPLPPGKGPAAEAGKRASAVLIQTVENYRTARAVYPMVLDDLIPDYLSRLPHLSNGSEIDYTRLGATYKITFSYTNPLPVHCSYQPGKKWECEWL
jgi:hypothetical protein